MKDLCLLKGQICRSETPLRLTLMPNKSLVFPPKTFVSPTLLVPTTIFDRTQRDKQNWTMTELHSHLETLCPIAEKILSLSGSAGASVGVLHKGDVILTEAFATMP